LRISRPGTSIRIRQQHLQPLLSLLGEFLSLLRCDFATSDKVSVVSRSLHRRQWCSQRDLPHLLLLVGRLDCRPCRGSFHLLNFEAFKIEESRTSGAAFSTTIGGTLGFRLRRPQQLHPPHLGHHQLFLRRLALLTPSGASTDTLPVSSTSSAVSPAFSVASSRYASTLSSTLSPVS